MGGKMKGPHWWEKTGCQHDYKELAKNGRPYAQNLKQFICRRCGHRKADRG